MGNSVKFNDLLGKRITGFTGKPQDSTIVITTECGCVYTLYHEQDCCENVYVEDITGCVDDLIGGIVTRAEEASQHNPHAFESGTWTFYRIDTDKFGGDVVIRFNGESNGYYSESVSIHKYVKQGMDNLLQQVRTPLNIWTSLPKYFKDIVIEAKLRPCSMTLEELRAALTPHSDEL